MIVTKLDSPDVRRRSREFLLIPQNDVETELLKALYVETTLTCFMHKSGLRIYIAKLEAA